MPEIPEMELYKNNLNATIRGKRIQRIWVYRKKSINCDPESFRKGVGYSSVDFVERKGKYLIFHLSNGLKLLAHMMLDGRLYYLTLENSPKFTISSKNLRGLIRDSSIFFNFSNWFKRFNGNFVERNYR